MVLLKTTPIEAMNAVRRVVYLIGSVPPRRNEPARAHFVNHLRWAFCTIHMGLGNLAMVWTLITYRNDFPTIVRVSPQFVACTVIQIRLIIWKQQWSNLQNLLEEWEEFVVNATEREEVILQKYCDKVSLFHFTPMTLRYIGVFIFATLPLVTAKVLPAESDFPFATEWGTPVWFYVYCAELIMEYTAGTAGTMDLILMMMLWSTSARYEMLQEEFSKVKSIDDFRRCVQKQKNLERSLSDQKIILNWMGFSITMIVLIGVSTGGFVVLNRTVGWELISFLIMMAVNSMQMFTYCWAGDTLMDTSQSLIFAIHNSNWYEASPELKRCLLIAMIGSGRPMIISVDGLLPVMSLELYASSMSAVVSYITTMRAFSQ